MRWCMSATVFHFCSDNHNFSRGLLLQADLKTAFACSGLTDMPDAAASASVSMKGSEKALYRAVSDPCASILNELSLRKYSVESLGFNTASILCSNSESIIASYSSTEMPSSKHSTEIMF